MRDYPVKSQKKGQNVCLLGPSVLSVPWFDCFAMYV